MSCGIGPGSSHHAACDCREAEFALNLREAEARAERLEKALESIATRCTEDTQSMRVPFRTVDAVYAIARAALLPPPEQKENANG